MLQPSMMGFEDEVEQSLSRYQSGRRLIGLAVPFKRREMWGNVC
jgi:hypothetical protein